MTTLPLSPGNRLSRLPSSLGRPSREAGRKVGAGNGSRTRDLNLGKVALYQLSYFRRRRDCSGSPSRGTEAPGAAVTPRQLLLLDEVGFVNGDNHELGDPVTTLDRDRF